MGDVTMFKTIGALTVGAVTAALMASATLAQDYTEPPSFGRVSLSSGFTPDPYVRKLTASGSMRAQDLVFSRSSLVYAPASLDHHILLFPRSALRRAVYCRPS